MKVCIDPWRKTFYWMIFRTIYDYLVIERLIVIRCLLPGMPILEKLG